MSLATEDRILVLLDALGRDAAELVLARLAPPRGDALRKRLAQRKSPPAAEDLDLVLDEFHRTLQFALSKTSPGKAAPSKNSTGLRLATETAEEDEELHEQLKPKARSQERGFQASDDPIADLNRLAAFQIGLALRDEPPRAIALVLGCLASDKAGATLAQLPPEVRNSVFLQLSTRPTTSPELLHGLVRATVAKGCLLDRRADKDAETDKDQKTADLLRAVDKAQQAEMLEALGRHDPDAAGRVRRLLLRFEDLARVTDRSLQSLLADVDTRTLATALKGANAAVSGKVMNNLSSRARASLKEEMDLMKSLSPAKQKEAREVIAETMGRMDQTGNLVMEES
jgi:flagellar motor switch protein FliG